VDFVAVNRYHERAHVVGVIALQAIDDVAQVATRCARARPAVGLVGFFLTRLPKLVEEPALETGPVAGLLLTKWRVDDQPGSCTYSQRNQAYQHAAHASECTRR
jgi:hypothetical protein